MKYVKLRLLCVIALLIQFTSCKTIDETLIPNPESVFNASLKEEMKKAVLYDFYDGDSSKIDFTKYPFN